MTRASDFRIVAVNAVAFIPPAAAGQFVPARFFSSLMGSHADLFNGEVSMLPLPPQVPAEIPRVLVNSQDKQWSLTGGPQRITVAWLSQTTSDNIPGDAVDRCSRILSEYFSANGAPPLHRLAWVVNRACAHNDAPNEIITNFCRTDRFDPNNPAAPLRHSRSFELHNLKRYDADGFTVNSWVRCKSANYNDENKTPIMVFEQDLNTAEEATSPLEPAQISGFFPMAVRETGKILGLYFPQVGESK